MGCRGSKNKKNAYARVAEYQKESWAAESAVRRAPQVFEWSCPPEGCISPTSVHHLLTDGFYAPYTANPLYLLLIDCRDARIFTKRRLSTAHWHGALAAAPLPEMCYSVVLYDDKPRSDVPHPQDKDRLAQLFYDLRRRKLDPQVVLGGWSALEDSCSHLMESGGDKRAPRFHTMPWYPALIIPGLLYLGHAEMASNLRVLEALRVTHVVSISDVVPSRVLPSLSYLVIPVEEEPPQPRGNASLNLVSSLPTLRAFINEARLYRGRVLVHCDQGLTRAAALVMAHLMNEKMCTLEDAFYYVKAARSALHPHPNLLLELVHYEKTLFGTSITQLDDLL